MNKSLTIEHNGQNYTGHIATIDRTELGIQDHGLMNVWLHCSWPGSGVGVGGYALDTYDRTEKKRVGTGYGLDFVMQVLDTVGVRTWEQIAGKQIIVLFDGDGGWGGSAVGFAHLSDDKALILSDHASAWKNREA